MVKTLIAFILVFILGACGLATTRPKMEMALAQTAFLAAKKAEAQSQAPNLYRKAEFYYLKAKSAYKRKYFNKAKQYAVLSQKFSEQAEYAAKKNPAPAK
ncbi:MAG: hypothetical protein COW00_12745 [Bdellovibrio sp. CG12_big_fil_rev_8_21_14_0_65_39_13]|nr:MAG: hypothetical protein COW78_05065 [Bdellovibrio sp. CG22_combo_CG10-13_8_21_14_all_39_27]PIQ58949.1 MAG: hypothetical protein COW00_12745 [Bdellovibrio sp. CG12_big_fil_rev_8_21_14_0_65_39_13]PIR33917.1 MAG: hypothetical protein COV37_14460 [Bdellovibrio sp. CG11_big_fil_rev_8_21_14_0_20_39_38]PJB54681.1 MAG: hypothetical protein CO099_00235 [Bdellovibrio sp. CG_4_9_14_3_um_filter_39_7]